MNRQQQALHDGVRIALSPSYDRRKLPRVREIGCSKKKLRPWWVEAGGPFRSRRAAFRCARELRDLYHRNGYRVLFGVWAAPRGPGSKFPRWAKNRPWHVVKFVPHRGRKSPYVFPSHCGV